MSCRPLHFFFRSSFNIGRKNSTNYNGTHLYREKYKIINDQVHSNYKREHLVGIYLFEKYNKQKTFRNNSRQLTVMQGIDCVNHQLQETMTKFSARCGTTCPRWTTMRTWTRWARSRFGGGTRCHWATWLCCCHWGFGRICSVCLVNERKDSLL